MAAEYKGSLAVFFTMGAFSFAPPHSRVWLFGFTGVVSLLAREWTVACFMSGIVLAIWHLDGLQHASPPPGSLSSSKNTTNHIIFFLSWWLLCQPSGHGEQEFSYATPGWYYMTQVVPRNYYYDEYWRFWNSIGAVMMVYSILNLSWAESFFRMRWVQFLGKVSFPFYLVHMPILWTIGDRICRLLGVVRHDFTTWYDLRLAVPDLGPRGISTGFLLSQMLILPLSLLVATWGLKYLDEPAIKTGRWVVAMLGLADMKSRRLIGR
jgi:hypothetical protein